MTQPPAPPAPREPLLPPPPPVPREALDFPVFFDPAPAVERWHRLRGAARWGVGSLLVNVAVWAAVWWFTRDGLWTEYFQTIAILSLALSVVLLLWAVLRAWVARRELGRLREGLALGVGRGGLFLEDTFLPWTELGGLEARPPKPLSGSARLQVRAAGGFTLTLPLDHLAQSPAAIDGAVRALSGGRAWLELGRLDD